MKNITFILSFIFILLLLSCNTNNKEIKMQEVAVFENYTVELPLKANQVKKNRWKIEYSSLTLTTIIATEFTQIISLNNCFNIAFDKNDSAEFKLHFNSKEEIDKPAFKIYINNYKGKAGASSFASTINFTCLILDELNTQKRFIFEINSLGTGHDRIVESIVNSFRKNIKLLE